MSFTGPGWYLLSTTKNTWNDAMIDWGIPTSTVYKYIYELNNAPIVAGASLTPDNWKGIDISINPPLTPMKAYWINIQTLIIQPPPIADLVLSGTGALTSATSKLNGATNVIIQDYASIGTSAFSGATSLQSIIIPSSVTSIGGEAFYNTTDLKTVTFAGNSQLTSSTIQPNAFQKSVLKTVIFENINAFQNLNLSITDAPQSFFGATVQALPTLLAVQTALQLKIDVATKAQQAVNNASDAVAIQEKAVEIPQATVTQAQETAKQAQATVTQALSTVSATQAQLESQAQLYGPAALMFPQYLLTQAQLTNYQNQLTNYQDQSTNASAALAAAQTQLNTAQEILDSYKLTLQNAQTALATANDLVTTLRNVTWAV